jgi:hypothetical protein
MKRLLINTVCFSLLPFLQGSLDIRAGLDKLQYLPGDTVTVTLNIRNESSVRLAAVLLAIKRDIHVRQYSDPTESHPHNTDVRL